jgi:tetratricopeptide (TPR) repeat protein
MNMNTEQNNKSSALDQIVYISIPDDAAKSIQGFNLDPKILIPVEIPEEREAWSIENLSWEMIVSAMLKIFAYDPSHKDLPYYRKFIDAVQPNIIAELTKTGIIKAEAKDFELAEEIFLALNHLAPGIETTFLNLAFLYEQQSEQYKENGDFSRSDYFADKAFNVYLSALEAHEESADIHFYAGYFFLKQNSLSKALEYFELFLGLAEDDQRSPDVQEIVDRIRSQSEDDMLFASAYDKIRMGHEREALSDIDEYITRHDDVWNAWFLKGWAHRRLGEYAEGRQALERSLEMEKSTTDIYNELAICCMELKDYEQAKIQLNKALTIEPDNVKVISNLGVIELKQENPKRALEMFRIAVEIDSEDPVASAYVNELIENGYDT